MQNSHVAGILAFARRALAIAVMLAVAPISPARAQTPMDSAAGARPASKEADPTARRPSPPITPSTRFVGRFALGSVGWLLGAYFGATTLDEAGFGGPWNLNGIALGAMAGTGLTVGMVSMRDGCSRSGRVGLAMVGAAAGMMVGNLFVNETNGLAFPVGTVALSAAVAGTCDGRR